DLLNAAISYPGKTMTFPIYAESQTRFHLRTFDGTLTFETGPDGSAQGVVFRIGGEDRKARRE
ncbi:MAG: hypothetical protein L6Q93_17090, partial [Phycisphaerae bacterium]|nr:hypothetical protein [Phycisphaerae bacterium]